MADSPLSAHRWWTLSTDGGARADCVRADYVRKLVRPRTSTHANLGPPPRGGGLSGLHRGGAPADCVR